MSQRRCEPLQQQVPPYLYIHWDVNAQLLVRLHGPHPGQHRALVISAAAAKQGAVLFRQLPRVRVPAILQGCGLHVQVAVDTAAAAADIDGYTL